MSAWNKGSWRHKKTKKVIHGDWIYVWSRDEFIIEIHKPKSALNVFGEAKTTVKDESPEWGQWKLIEPKKGKT